MQSAYYESFTVLELLSSIRLNLARHVNWVIINLIHDVGRRIIVSYDLRNIFLRIITIYSQKHGFNEVSGDHPRSVANRRAPASELMIDIQQYT
jgi:hypothetical protein